MELKCKIICEKFEQKTKIDKKIYDVEQSEEYYVIPLSKSYDVKHEDGIFELMLKNQQLLLKYSNRFGEILLKDYDYGCEEFILIKSRDIIDIYVRIISNNYFRRNVWQTNTVVYMNKKCVGEKYLILPIIEDMISIKEFGEGIPIINIEMITNEILLREVQPSEKNCYLNITNNFLLNKDALFVRLNDGDVQDFVGVAH